ncbi:MAG: VWA domain-containing protein [Treponema sp.]|nr:VWA domain-containing protein [Treponema sp.]
MKKMMLAIMLTLGITFSSFAQQAAGPMDLVVVLDTSASMSNYHWQTSDYLAGPFLREFLRIGDTFHLISFAETPRMEISRRIGGAGDVEIIIARMLLMHPLGSRANLDLALSFAERYAAALPMQRPRKIILISDGAAPNTESLVSAASTRLSAQNAELRFIRVPVTGDGPVSGRPIAPAPTVIGQPPTAPPTAPAVQAPVAPPPAIQQPPAAQQPPTAQPPAPQAPGAQPPAAPPAIQQPPVTQQPPTAQPPAPQAPGAQPPADQYPIAPPGAEPPIAQAPDAQPPEAQAPAAVPPAAQPPVAPPPAVGLPAAPPAPQAGAGLFADGIPLPLLILLILLALALLGFLIFLASRRLDSSPNRAVAQAARPPEEQKRDADLMSRYAESQKSQARPPLQPLPPTRKARPKDTLYPPAERQYEGPMMLNLFVEDQNTAIGRRNIHTAKPGHTFSVGGGKSDFLVFLVPIPPHIADIRCDGANCTFIPRKPQYFPDIGSQSVSSCIGKTIRVVSDKNYELYIRIERYEDPLKALNKLLNSITVPGEVK